MEREAVLLRADLSRVERGRGKRFAAELRGRVIEFALRRRPEGASWTLIGSELAMRAVEQVRISAIVNARFTAS